MKVLEPEVIAFAGEHPGEVLRRAREVKHWSQADVALQLNLTVQALAFLESGAFANLPGNTFARGYIRAYAKLLGIDQEPLVVAFDQLTGSNAAGSSVQALGRIEEPAHVAQNILRVISFVLLAGLALGSYLWWQDRTQLHGGASLTSGMPEHVEVEGADGNTQMHPLDEPEDQAVSVAETTELALTEIAPELAAQPEATVLITPSSPLLNAQPATVAAPLAEVPTSPQAREPAVAVVAPASPVAQVAVIPATGEAVVGVQFTANCWAQLTDANGKVLFSALKRAGETLELAGKPPLELRLGYARGARVSFNGQNIDVASYTSGETARIKLGL